MGVEYQEMILAKVVRVGKPDEFFAVSEKTLENMENSSSDMEYCICSAESYAENQFKVVEMGKILVEPIWK